MRQSIERAGYSWLINVSVFAACRLIVNVS